MTHHFFYGINGQSIITTIITITTKLQQLVLDCCLHNKVKYEFGRFASVWLRSLLQVEVVVGSAANQGRIE